MAELKGGRSAHTARLERGWGRKTDLTYNNGCELKSPRFLDEIAI